MVTRPRTRVSLIRPVVRPDVLVQGEASIQTLIPGPPVWKVLTIPPQNLRQQGP